LEWGGAVGEGRLQAQLVLRSRRQDEAVAQVRVGTLRGTLAVLRLRHRGSHLVGIRFGVESHRAIRRRLPVAAAMGRLQFRIVIMGFVRSGGERIGGLALGLAWPTRCYNLK